MGAWLLPMFGSSLSFAFADVLCDIVILENHDGSERDEDEHAADDDGDGDMVKDVAGDHGGRELAPGASGEIRPMIARSRAASNHSDHETSLELNHEEEGLTGEQDTAMAGFTNMAGLFAAGSYWYMRGTSGEGLSLLGGGSGTLAGGARGEVVAAAQAAVFVWGPTTHIEFWAAMAGGVLTFAHYYLLLKAFEGASSTVLLPLVQVASVATLLGSAVISLVRQEAWITSRHLCAYLLLFVGGVLPACDGQLRTLLRVEFWRQPFVWCTILSELSLGAHDLLLNLCSYHGPAPGRAAGDAGAGAGLAIGALSVRAGVAEPAFDDSFQFFFYSRVAFCATFAILFASSSRLTNQVRALLRGTVPAHLIRLSLLSEALTVMGYYLASIAYSLFYQAAVVHTAEASMSQLLNLMVAYVLHNGFAIGRASAASGLQAKLISFGLVTLGLYLCGEEGGGGRR